MHEGLILLTVIAVYCGVSTFIFDYIYNASQIVIDEKFHLPMGLQYCKFNYSVWDNKITTLPGLYLYSSIITGPPKACSVYALRYTVFLASLLNIVAVHQVHKQFLPEESIGKRILNVVNIILTPPVFFFSFVYYTDILSLSTVMWMVYCGLTKHAYIGSALGFISIIVRQNNVIYILFTAGLVVFEHLFDIIKRKKLNRQLLLDCNSIKTLFRKCELSNFRDLIFDGLCYTIPLLAFGVFVYLNGSIVVGDKEAHHATVHLPQVLYFTMFVMFFSWPHILPMVKTMCRFFFRRIVMSILLMCIIVFIINANTIVHPYLLADNRHYTFYIWNRFLSTTKMRLLFAPVYLVGLYVLARFSYRPNNVRFTMVYFPMLVLILSTQSLIDVRYFLTPYVILRTFLATKGYKYLMTELIFHIMVSVVTLYIFGHKEIFWKDFDEAQRIIW